MSRWQNRRPTAAAMPQLSGCIVTTRNERDDAIRALRHTAPANLWPAFEQNLIFGRCQTSPATQLFLKRAKRLRISRMIFAMFPFDFPLRTRQRWVLAILHPYLRDEDAHKDVLGICEQMELKPATTIYYDVLLKECRYFNGNVPEYVQNVQKFKKVVRRKRRSLEDYLFHCAVSGSRMPCTTRSCCTCKTACEKTIGAFMCASENNAKDFFV